MASQRSRKATLGPGSNVGQRSRFLAAYIIACHHLDLLPHHAKAREQLMSFLLDLSKEKLQTEEMVQRAIRLFKSRPHTLH